MLRASGEPIDPFVDRLVFDGRSDRLYTEEDLPAPLNYYGVTKYQGEQAVASICRNYAIVRVVVVYGKALPGQHGNVLQLVKNRLEAGQEIRVVADQYRTPTWVEDIARRSGTACAYR